MITYEFVSDCVDMMVLTTLAHLYNLGTSVQPSLLAEDVHPPPPVCVLCSGLIQPETCFVNKL